jgi:protein-L-isoaspartate(D-aspartate) O-methyltransferase
MQPVDYELMRRAMVESQLRTSGVSEPWLLAAMGSVAREDFVPESHRATAYMDRSIARSDGSVINPPVTTALMLQAAEVTPTDRALLIGDGSGYTAAVLAQRTGHVVASVDGSDAESSGFSVVLIDGAVEVLPEAIVAALAEGGRLVTGTVEKGVTSLAFGIKRAGAVALRHFADVEIALLPQFAKRPEFVF